MDPRTNVVACPVGVNIRPDRRTDYAVIDVTAEGLIVRELVDDLDFAALQAKTEASLRPAPDMTRLTAPAI